MPREVSGHWHHASDLVAVLCHLKFGRIKNQNLQTSSIPVFRTHKLTPLNSVSRRQSVWHFEKSSVLSATKNLFRQNIAQRGESPLVDNFGPEFGQEGIHPKWTRWPKCVSQSQLGSVVVPFAHVIRDRCGSFGKVNAHVNCGLCLCLLFLNGRGDFKNYLQRNTERENI